MLIQMSLKFSARFVLKDIIHGRDEITTRTFMV
jgi:hypothetical protein